jgi:ubiquinone/menaquinone biosynthesis C-methylase UbiE
VPARDERPGETEREIQGPAPALYYEQRKRHYQDARVAAGYDARRFEGSRSRRNRAKWRAIDRALALAGRPAEVLDLPTGTGRFVDSLLGEGGVELLVGADISREMMTVAQYRTAATAAPAAPAAAATGAPSPGRPEARRRADFVQCDAEALPFRDGSFDAVLTIRFFFHLPPDVRARILREMARVSRRWVIADYRHRHSLRHALRRLGHAVGLRPAPPPRISREELEREVEAAGLRVREVFVVTPLFSDKWVVLCERR